jgi:hypothetical protein
MSKSGALSGTIPGGRGGIRLTPSGVQETEEVYSLQVGEPLFSLVTGVEASDGRISAKPCLG